MVVTGQSDLAGVRTAFPKAASLPPPTRLCSFTKPVELVDGNGHVASVHFPLVPFEVTLGEQLLCGHPGSRVPAGVGALGGH